MERPQRPEAVPAQIQKGSSRQRVREQDVYCDEYSGASFRICLFLFSSLRSFDVLFLV